MRLNGKTALITGGGSGIGLAIAKQYASEGAFVYITGRRGQVLENAKKEIGENCAYAIGDVSDRASMEELARRIHEERGSVDIVICNAGVGGYVSLENITEKEFDRVMHTNVLGSYFTVQACLPYMPEGSTIILNTSVTASLGLKDFSLYIAAKSAQKSFIHTWTNELRDRRIRVNAIAPGIIPTEAAGKELGRSEEEELERQRYRSTLIPSARVGNVKDIANAAVFLGSDESSYINGVEILVDGGLAAVYPVKL